MPVMPQAYSAYQCCLLDPEARSQKANVVVLLLVVGISSLKVQKSLKAFLIRSGAQRNFAYTFVLTLPTDPPSQIFHLGPISNK